MIARKTRAVFRLQTQAFLPSRYLSTEPVNSTLPLASFLLVRQPFQPRGGKHLRVSSQPGVKHLPLSSLLTSRSHTTCCNLPSAPPPVSLSLLGLGRGLPGFFHSSQRCLHMQSGSITTSRFLAGFTGHPPRVKSLLNTQSFNQAPAISAPVADTLCAGSSLDLFLPFSATHSREELPAPLPRSPTWHSEPLAFAPAAS